MKIFKVGGFASGLLHSKTGISPAPVIRGPFRFHLGAPYFPALIHHSPPYAMGIIPGCDANYEHSDRHNPGNAAHIQ